MIKGQKNHSKGKVKGGNTEDIPSNCVYGAYEAVETAGDMEHPSSTWEFPEFHPLIAISSTEKPIELCRYAIRTFTDPSTIVLDNCCGRRPVPIAAKFEERHYIDVNDGVCDNKKSKYSGIS